MDSLTFVIVMLLLVVASYQVPMEKLDDVLVYPVEPTTNIRKRETSTSTKIKQKNASFDAFVEEKLIQHTQALEHLVKMVQNNEELTKNLIENLSEKLEKPKLPEKVEVHRQTRNSNGDNDDDDNPIFRLGKNIPKYGILFKDMILKQVQDDSDPTPIVEQEIEPSKFKFYSRRSFNGPPMSLPVLQTENKISPWCSVAIVCHRTVNPVCGYDDNFGYGKFDDICHMLQVNCYWKYNFALVPNCKPTL